MPVVAGEGREARTIDALEHVARWLRLSVLTNPTSQLPPTPCASPSSTGDGRTEDGGTVEIAYAGDTPPSSP